MRANHERFSALTHYVHETPEDRNGVRFYHCRRSHCCRLVASSRQLRSKCASVARCCGRLRMAGWTLRAAACQRGPNALRPGIGYEVVRGDGVYDVGRGRRRRSRSACGDRAARFQRPASHPALRRSAEAGRHSGGVVGGCAAHDGRCRSRHLSPPLDAHLRPARLASALPRRQS